MKIIRAESTVVIDAAGRLFEEYAASLPFDLCFQNFEQELLGLPGEYAPPTGCLLVAILNEDVAAGCVALRQLEAGIGEMKRLFVRPAHRGIGLGKRLAREILTEAVGLGYERVRLDTTPTMTEALCLYREIGFREIEPYRHNPIEGAIYMEIVLKKVA